MDPADLPAGGQTAIPTQPRPLRIGPITLANNLILAPMAGVTDRPFRELCRSLGAGLAVSEMVSADTSLWGHRKSLRRLDHRGETGPIAAQILGNEPALMAEAARINLDLGADIIDLNMGCPARKVCRKAAGSALLRDERLVGRILAAVVAAVPAPVTLKIRTGWSPEERNAPAIARIAWESGIAALAVHGRTRACGFVGQAEFETLRAIRRAVPIPLIANGDIDSPERARFVLDFTGADAIMIGRAAQGRPWIFREIAHHLATGTHLPSPSPDWIRTTLIAHLHALHRFYGDRAGPCIARKHVGWYTRARRDASGFRAEFNRVNTLQEQQILIEAYFDEDKQRGYHAA
ncbi:MAG: tRNA dihydrouridine synthase DusB [Chromatiaceae bacterium]